MDQERDDYADLNLLPPLQWSRAGSAIIGLIVAGITFVVLMLLMLLAYNLCRERPPKPADDSHDFSFHPGQFSFSRLFHYGVAVDEQK
jgi:hypothetical protein